MSTSRVIRAPRGTQLICKNWFPEAAYRMIPKQPLAKRYGLKCQC
jgi:urocanate hydratase